MALVGEGLVAELEVALVGSLAGVEPVVGFEVTFFEEGLPTAWVRAVEVSLADVLLNVDVQPLDLRVRHLAPRVGALELPLISVNFFMNS